ncbi:glycosyltransferase family 39 protein [Spirulina sp. CS-785/01]|uniref:glycosyltransferase family 39 protein n=1 Tax=Spirulina sp. CS-785/01 TaxID=3021716 RepID=UPI00232B5E95|nr:glycosyltransferase family 39 protein [Spirulina sp. CS-785/01]MDB9314370.1 glycosyltransferase family 39 protein [Spirulina sp. CS-785/01]
MQHLTKHLPSGKLRWFFLTLLVLGIILRFYQLGDKVFWHDEVHTALRISGYSATEVIEEVFTGEVVQPEDLLQYQQPHPQRSPLATVSLLAKEDSQHPPVYYLLAAIWVRVFGASPAILRSLSAILSLLVFPAIYWLCWELFQSPLTGWLAISLVTVSPFHLLYAQEAREYSLWTVLILLMSAAFLRAIRITKAQSSRSQSTTAWGLYSFLCGISFYTHPFSGLVALSHGVYLLLREKFRPTHSLFAYSIALFIAILAFWPWLTILITSWSKTGATWTSNPLPFVIWGKLWLMHISRGFVLTIGNLGFDTWLNYLTLPFLLLLLAYGYYVLIRQTPSPVWLFVLALTLSVTLPLTLPDLILGGQRATSSRYFVPLYLGLQVTLAFLLSHHVTSPHTRKRRLGQGLTVVLLTLGWVSCLVYTGQETAWTKVISYSNPQIVQRVKQSDSPLLISNSFGYHFGNIISLCYDLPPSSRLILLDSGEDEERVPDIPPQQDLNAIYTLNISEQLEKRLENEYNLQLELIYNDVHLWLLKSQEGNAAI